MADQIENKIVNVIFNNKDFSKNIDATIKDLQRFEKEIDNISKINLKNIEIKVDIDFDNSILYDKLKEIDKNSNINLKVNYNNEKLYTLQKDISNIKIPNIKLDIDYETLSKNITNAIENVNKSGIFGRLWASILDFPGSIISGIGYQIGTNIVGESFGSGLVSKASGMFTNLIGGIFLKESSLVGDNIGKNISNSIDNSLNSDFKGIDFSGLLNNIKEVFSKVGDFISPIVTNIKSKLSMIDFSGLLNKFKSSFSKVTTFMSPFINTIKTKIQNIDLKGFTTKFKSAFNKITTFVSPLANTIKTIIQNIDLKGFTTKFKSAFNKIGEMVSPLANKIKEKLSNINVNGIVDKVNGVFKKISGSKLLTGAGILGGGLLLSGKLPIVNNLLSKLTGNSEEFNRSVENIGNSVDTISSKFTVMGRVWFDTLTRMVQNAVDAGMRMVKSLSVDNIISGYSAMEAKNNSIRTIMNSTVNNVGEDDEAKLERITDNVEKLVTFTDETSYNFQDMMNGLSSFTSAGVGLEKSVSYMMGIANWAAYAGKNAKEAGTAFDVMSKVIANGNMDLMRFRQLSTQGFISNATRKQWLEMAAKVGTLKKEINSAGDAVYRLADGTEVTAQNMETTLTKGKWLNSDVITQSLGEYAKFSDTVMAYYNNINNFQEEMTETGEDINEMSAERLNELSKKYNLATSDLQKFADEEVTVSKLIDILGDQVDENGVRVFEKFSVEAFKSAQEARTFGDAIESVKVAVSAGWSKSFETIFGNVEEQSKLWTGLANKLYEVFMAGTTVRNAFLKFAKDAGAFENIIMGISNLFNSLLRILGTVSNAFKSIFFPSMLSDENKAIKDYANTFAKWAENFAIWTAKIAPSDETIENITNTLRGLFSIVKVVMKAIMAIPWSMIFTILIKVSGAIGSIITSISNGLLNSGVLEKVSKSFDKIGNSINKISSPDIINSLLKVLGILVVLKLALEAMRAFSSIKNIAKGMETLQKSMRANVIDKQATAMLKLAGAVALISASLFVLSKIDFMAALKGLVIVAAELAIVIAAMWAINKIGISSIKVNTIAIALIGFAGAILLLTASVAILGNLKWGALLKGLLGVGLLLAGFVIGFKELSNSLKGFKSLNLIPVAASIIAFAGAMILLSASVAILGHIDRPKLIQGLIAIGVLLAGFTLAFVILSKAIGTLESVELLPIAAAIIAFAGAMILLSASVAILGHIDRPKLIQGLIAIGVLLAGFTLAFVILSKAIGTLGSIDLLLISGSILIFAGAMVVLGAAVSIFSGLSENINDSLLSMAKVLGGIIVFAIILSHLNITAGALQIIVLAGALLLASVSFKILQDIDFNKVAKGLLTLLVAMTGLSVIGYLANGAAVGLISLSIVLLSAGAAAFLFGEGIKLGAEGIDLLSKVDYQKIVDGFSLIAYNADKLLEAALALAAVGLSGIISGIGAAFQGLGDTITGIGSAVKGIGEGISLAVKGIGEGIGNFFAGGSEEEKLMKKAEALMKIADAMDRLKDIGNVSVSTEGLQSAIDNVIQEFSKSIQDIEQYGLQSASNYIEGLNKGMTDAEALEKLKAAAYNLASSIKNKFDEVLKIQSPSKVGREEGGYYVIGIKDGIITKTRLTEEAAKKLGISITEGTEDELSQEKAKEISDNWADYMVESSEEKVNDFKTVGRDTSGYYVEGIIDGVEGKRYLTEEEAKKLGLSMTENTKQPFTDEKQKKNLIDDITSFATSALKEASNKLDVNNMLENVLPGVTDNLNPTTSTNNGEEDEETLKKKQKAHESYLKNYKNQLKSEKDMVKYYAEQEKKVDQQKVKDKVEGFTQTLVDQKDYTASAQSNMTTWLDNLANSYEQADASFNDYLENLDENISAEDKANARRMEALKKWQEEWKRNSGFSWDMSGKEEFKQEKTELKSKDILKNQASQLQGYKNFVAEIEKLAGTNVSNEFIRAVWEGGPSSDIYKNAISLSDSELENFAANYDFILGVQKKDSEVLERIIRNRAQYQSAKLQGIKYNPESDNIVITQPTVTFEYKKSQIIDNFKDSGADEEEAKELFNQYNDRVKELRDEGTKLADAKKQAYQEIMTDLNGDYTEDSELNPSEPASQTIIPSNDEAAYQAGYNQVVAASTGVTDAKPILDDAINKLNQSINPQQAINNEENKDDAEKNNGLLDGFKEQGKLIDESMAKGITDNIQTVVNATTQMCLDAIQAARAALGIASPSTEFYKIGEFIIQGLCNAITDGQSAVTNAMVSEVLAKMEKESNDYEENGSPSKKWYRFGSFIDQGLANGISENASAPLNILHDLISDISENMELDDEYNPVITPVVDLTEVQSQSKQISTLFAKNQAVGISANMTYDKLHQNGGQNNDPSLSKPTNITFTQNNYSPKELSRLDIYRQTNNQFSKFKTLLDK